jgi:hypothetical protein
MVCSAALWVWVGCRVLGCGNGDAVVSLSASGIVVVSGILNRRVG